MSNSKLKPAKIQNLSEWQKWISRYCEDCKFLWEWNRIRLFKTISGIVMIWLWVLWLLFIWVVISLVIWFSPATAIEQRGWLLFSVIWIAILTWFYKKYLSTSCPNCWQKNYHKCSVAHIWDHYKLTTSKQRTYRFSKIEDNLISDLTE